MSTPKSVVHAQLEHLLGVIDHHRQERCDALLEQARSQAQQIIKQAHHDARNRFHQHALDTRESMRRQLASAESQHQTRLRQQRQQVDQALLTRAWPPLREALLHRWQDETQRRRWIDHLVQLATAKLLANDWRIEHPADMTASDREAVQSMLRKRMDCRTEFTASTEIVAGMRICAGNTCVDGTLEGLLRDHRRIEALLLARINTQPESGE